MESIWSTEQIITNIFQACYMQGNPTQLGCALWFFKSLFFVSVSYCVVDFLVRRFLPNKYHDIIQGAISCLLLMVGYYFSLPGHSSYLLGRFSYYILFFGGYTIHKYIDGRFVKNNVFPSCILLICLLSLIACDSIGHIELADNYYYNPLFLIVSSFLGWGLMASTQFFISKFSYLTELFVCIGQNSLFVVILHFLCFKVINCLGVALYDYPGYYMAAFPVLLKTGGWWVTYLMVGVSIPVILSIIWDKLKALLQKHYEQHS